MNNKVKKNRRRCSFAQPVMYFLLEVTAIIFIAYIASGGSVTGNLGFIIIVVGIGYSILKLPTFLNRVQRCKEIESRAKKRAKEEAELDDMTQWT